MHERAHGPVKGVRINFLSSVCVFMCEAPRTHTLSTSEEFNSYQTPVTDIVTIATASEDH